MIAFLETINHLDQSIFFFFNGMHNSFWDVVMPLFTMTKPWLIFYAVIIFFIVRKYRSKAVIILIILALAILISDQFSGLVKELVKRLRPTHDPAIQSLVHNVYKKGGLFSFFSAHATNTFAVAFFTTKLFKNIRYTILIFFWATLVSYTRIYIGVHYPFDILTGMIVGMLIGYFMYKLLTFTENQFFLLKTPKLAETGLDNQESMTIIFVFVLFIATVLLAIAQLQSHQII